MNALFVIDPLAGFDAEIDSNIGLMVAVQAEGGSVWVSEPEDLAVVEGRLLARARRISLRPRFPRGDHRWFVETPWFDELEHRVLDVADEVSIALLRLDPPVDPRYLRTTYLLDVAASAGVTVINHPCGVREFQEKLFVLRFPELCPPTVVTADALRIDDFLRSHGDSVIKPVDGFAGIDVWLLRRDDPNIPSLVESATARGTRHVVVQQFLPSVAAGNKRLFVLDGEIVGAVDRVPSPEDFRIGPPSASVEPDARDNHIVRVLAPELRRLGIVLAGLDVIDGRLIEVNVTCPGGMHKTDALLGTDLSGAIVRRLLQRNEERVLT
jgi:glutathione synthase